jgi:hypothetical protein
MSQFDSNKDYYGVLGVDKDASAGDIYRQYNRQAAKHHPDRGGSEEQMKSLNEAYGVLKNSAARRAYDDSRTTGAYSRTTTDEWRTGDWRTTARHARAGSNYYAPASTRAARDVGVMGQCLSALLCLVTGLFLLLLVRFQWMWFLWPLAILAVSVTGFGVLLARSAMVAVNDSLPKTNRLKRHTKLQEFAFWAVIITTGYGLYLVLSS